MNFNGDTTTSRTDSAYPQGSAQPWQHIAVTVTKNSSAITTFTFHVDGNLVDHSLVGGSTLSDTNHQLYTTSENFLIGCRNNGGTLDTFVEGRMDEVAIWSETLTEDNIEKVYNSGVPFDLTGDDGNYDNSNTLVGYWRMNEGNGTTAEDTGGSNNATLTGGATYSNDNV